MNGFLEYLANNIDNDDVVKDITQLNERYVTKGLTYEPLIKHTGIIQEFLDLAKAEQSTLINSLDKNNNKSAIFLLGMLHLGDRLDPQFEFDNFIPSIITLTMEHIVDVYNENEEMVHGAYSALNNQDDGLFATPLIEGDSIILEYFEPDNASFNGNIEIERIVHDYRDILNFNNQNTPSSRCGTNVVCPEGEDFIDQINAGSWLDMGSYICSGSMINNTSNDLTPYYMTAWHCTDGLNESTFRFYFNYETETCEGSNSSYGAYSYGSIIRSSSNGNDPDFTLLEITDEISDTWDDVFYAGWDRSSSPPLINSGVHHPGGDPKKINFDDDYAQHSPGINWQDIGYSPPGSHWGVIWDVGCTEGGSSGSPAYNSDGRFIGQLTGGNSWAYYGKFSRGWDGDSPATRLKDWLDPNDTGVTYIDGTYNVLDIVSLVNCVLAQDCSNL